MSLPPGPGPGPATGAGAGAADARAAASGPRPLLRGEVMLDARAVLVRRLVRLVWKPALLLAAMWLLLVTDYVFAASPTFWLLSPLVTAGSEQDLSDIIRYVGFTPTGIVVAMITVPIIGTLACLGMIPLAARWAAAVRPRRIARASEVGHVVGRRIGRALVAPAIAVVIVLVISVLAGVPQPWGSLSFGAVGGLAAGIGIIWSTAAIIARVIDPARLITPDLAPEDIDAVPPAIAQQVEHPVLVDPRPLPPSAAMIEHPAPGIARRSLRVTLTALAPWWAATMILGAWIIFTIADVVVVIDRLGGFERGQSVRTGLPWSFWLLSAVLALPVIAALALGPRRAVRMAGVPETHQKATLWRRQVATLSGMFAGLTIGFVSVLEVVLLPVIGADAFAITGWVMLHAVVVALLAIGVVRGAVEAQLGFIIYGPDLLVPAPGGSGSTIAVPLERRTRFALVAPAQGSRADMPGTIAPGIPRRELPAASEGELPDFGQAAAGPSVSPPPGPVQASGSGRGPEGTIPTDVSSWRR